MANLWGSTTSGQAMQYGQNALATSLQTMFQKQQMDMEKQAAALEKQKINFMQMIQKAESTRQDIILKQQQDQLKDKETYFRDVGTLIEGLFDDKGNVNKPVAQKIMALQAAKTGTVSKAFLDFLKPQESKPFTVGDQTIYDPVKGEFVRSPFESSKETEQTKKDHEARVERHYKALMDDWNKYAAGIRKEGKDPGLPDTVTMIKQAEAKASKEETWKTSGRPYIPARKVGVGATEKPSSPFNLIPYGGTGNLSKFLGLGPAYKFGGKPAAPVQTFAAPIPAPAPKPASYDLGEDIYVSMRSGLASDEELRNEYRAMKKTQGK